MVEGRLTFWKKELPHGPISLFCTVVLMHWNGPSALFFVSFGSDSKSSTYMCIHDQPLRRARQSKRYPRTPIPSKQNLSPRIVTPNILDELIPVRSTHLNIPVGTLIDRSIPSIPVDLSSINPGLANVPSEQERRMSQTHLDIS